MAIDGEVAERLLESVARIERMQAESSLVHAERALLQDRRHDGVMGALGELRSRQDTQAAELRAQHPAVLVSKLAKRLFFIAVSVAAGGVSLAEAVRQLVGGDK